MDTVFFLVSKLLGAALRPESWLVMLAVLAFVAQARFKHRLGLFLSGGLVALLVGLAVVPVGGLLLRPLEAAYPMNPPLGQVQGIILLGGAEDMQASRHWGGIQLRGSSERLIAVAELARRYPAARILVAGGGGRLRDIGGTARSEARLAADFLVAQGVAEGRLVLEDRSRNTAENARLGRDMAAPKAGEVWVLVTSAFHMPRAMQSFAAAGWTGQVAWPVDYRSSGLVDGLGWSLPENLDLLNLALREWVGILAYRMTGR